MQKFSAFAGTALLALLLGATTATTVHLQDGRSHGAAGHHALAEDNGPTSVTLAPRG
ncbi:hypothetical protein ACWEN3_28080 [Streptomyces sp. NPDC004561]